MRRFVLSATLVASLFLAPAESSFPQEEKYCSAVIPCPVLNSPDMENVFGGRDRLSVKVDSKGLIREMEFIAFPGTVFEIIRSFPKNSHRVLEVITAEYTSSRPLFIDSRFVSFSENKPAARPKKLPSEKQIISSMLSMKGQSYMWGGNFHSGIKQMTEYFPPAGKLGEKELSLWSLEGVDCSGLIYEASEGCTPRNTSDLLSFGNGVNIEGLSAEEISRKVKPLDLIVWQGHVVIVLGPGKTIESTHPEGVIVSDLVTRLNSIMKERSPANRWNSSYGKIFVIRRWYTQP
ncbi:MAG TPA: NlpC/P60 family protein [Candidatus Omnitrophota bacterium]|nr:NlpC/P60 family protein [Candidatus Omnitrophota bacterium]